MFSQSWDSPSPDLQVTPSPPSPVCKDRNPVLGLRLANIFTSRGMEMENLERLHQKMEDLTGFNQSTWGVFAIQKQLFEENDVIFNDVGFFWTELHAMVGLSEKKTPGFDDVLPKTIRRLRLRRQKCRLSETRGTTKQIWLLSLKVMICPSLSIFWDGKKVRPPGENLSMRWRFPSWSCKKIAQYMHYWAVS